MSQVVRFGVSIEDKLLKQFDKLIEERNYVNRSEAVRDLIRSALVERDSAGGNVETIATVTIVYSHQTRELSDKLNDHQHSHHHSIVSALHVHLDHDHCLEVVIIRGTPKEIRHIADGLIGAKGVVHGKLVMSTLGQNLA
jgi:CopG family nickel-responsive transcriptional regulator